MEVLRVVELAVAVAGLVEHAADEDERRAPDTIGLYDVVRASWPDEQVFRCRLDELHRKVKDEKIRRTALILVGAVLDSEDYTDSKLYDAEHFHLLRPKKKRSG